MNMKSVLFITTATMALIASCVSDRHFMTVSTTTEEAPEIHGITFAVKIGEIYLPLEKVEGYLKKKVVSKEKRKKLRMLVDGTPLITLKELEKFGAKVVRDESDKTTEVRSGKHYFNLVVGSQRAEVDLSEQRLRAWQGKSLILESRVSSGRRSRTPTGKFRAGPYKARHHYSSLYDNASMPWSVQVSGHVFIHGFTSVPNYPASHGCIRVPLNEGNPAKFFYEWVKVGTPIHVRK